MNALVIIESAYKAPAIKGYLGKGYKVMSSGGHLRDLPKSKFGIDIENEFKPEYINIRGKGDLINELRKAAKAADIVLLATDPDREGEAISWHLSTILAPNAKNIKRISFNEVTKTAVKAAVKNPRDIDMNLVDAQQARRILDRLVGYKISPILWKNIRSGLSAGRVQSVVTRMIVEREEEIKSFVPEEYWNLSAILGASNGEFTAKLAGKNGTKLEINNAATAQEVYDGLQAAEYKITSIKKAVKQRKPLPPLITSTLTQEANKKFGFQAQRIMKTAQELYEGISLGDRGTHGLITYMRTDSLRVSDEARESAKQYILGTYGENYYPKTPNVYKSRNSAQDAHEAIRPTSITETPEKIASRLTADQLKIYTLIWERFVASQMANALLDTVVAEISAGEYNLRAGGYTVRFNGYTILAHENTEENGDDELTKGRLPELFENEILNLVKLVKEQKFTQPPAHYNEASLIKTLEEKGIGRPSTYGSTISTIISREYVVREGKALLPTKLAYETNDLMKEHFAEIVDYNFTAKMEEDLDRVEDGTESCLHVLESFYTPFSELLEKAQNAEKLHREPELSELKCPQCGEQLVIKAGRYGKFAACPNYPACRHTVKLDASGAPAKADTEPKEEVIADEKCEKCGSDMVLRSGRYGQFYACRNYPACKNTKPILNDIGIPCPKCGKRLVYKRGKKRGGFYSCEGYPECNFFCWDTPIKEKCPQCGSLLLKSKQKKQIYCYKECGYTANDNE